MRSARVRSTFLLSLAAVLLAGVVPQLATAAAFPDRPIRLIVPFPPGGSNDVLGRYVAVKLTDRVGQQVVVDNRAGANGIIGADLASKSAPDGHTLLMVSVSWVMNAAVRPLPYDVEKSFDPIATVGVAPNCIVVHPGSGITTIIIPVMIMDTIAGTRAPIDIIMMAKSEAGRCSTGS